jgi:hypothetical protein
MELSGSESDVVHRRIDHESAARAATGNFADTGAMRRTLALLLALALLLQMSWAAAATYCEHETSSKESMHFGHHVHVHKSADGKKQSTSKLTVDNDCSGCHASHAAIIPLVLSDVASDTPASVSFSQPFIHGSAPARTPDRPQWLRLA